MRLDEQQMDRTLATFAAVVNDALDKLVDEDMHLAAVNWINEMRLLEVHALFRPDMIAELNLSICHDETIRNFLFEIQFRFYALAGSGQGYIEGLCTNLAQALLIDGPVAELNVLPEVLSMHMPLAFLPGPKPQHWLTRLKNFFFKNQVPSLFDFLLNNPHIVTVLLFSLMANEEKTES